VAGLYAKAVPLARNNPDIVRHDKKGATQVAPSLFCLVANYAWRRDVFGNKKPRSKMNGTGAIKRLVSTLPK